MMKETIKTPNVRLFYDRILTTFENSSTTKNGILLLNPDSKQTVVACGPNSNVKVGDEIEIDFRAFPKRHEYPKNGIGADKEITILPIENINGVEYLFLSSREIKWVYNND